MTSYIFVYWVFLSNCSPIFAAIPCFTILSTNNTLGTNTMCNIDWYCYRLICQSEHELEAILLCVRIPVRPIPIPSIVGFVLDFSGRNSESNGFIRFGRNLNVWELEWTWSSNFLYECLQWGTGKPCLEAPFFAPRRSWTDDGARHLPLFEEDGPGPSCPPSQCLCPGPWSLDIQGDQFLGRLCVECWFAWAQSSTACLWHRGQRDEQGWFDAFFLGCALGRSLRWCVVSSIIDIQEIPNDFGEYKDPGSYSYHTIFGGWWGDTHLR